MTKRKRNRSEKSQVAEQPLLCYWGDMRGDFHLGANQRGGEQLGEALRQLLDAPHSRSLVLPLNPEVFHRSRNPASHAGEGRVFQQLRLERVDDLGRIRMLYAHAPEPHMAEILVSPDYLDEFIRVVTILAGGRGDFSFGPTRQERWKFDTLDRLSGEVWCWCVTPDGRLTHF